MNSPVTLAAQADPTEREKFNFEKESKNAERRVARIGLWLKRKELRLKEVEAARARWTNPLLVAVIGAALLGLGNFVITAINLNHAQYAREDDARRDIVKAENTNILEIVKMNDRDKVKDAFCLMLKFKSFKTDTTISSVQSYVDTHGGCESALAATAHSSTSAGGSLTGEWLTASKDIPGCGIGGCYQPTAVCGNVPAGKRATGNFRNFGDSFSGAWGQWGDPPIIAHGSVCRYFIQHSHNVSRRVSFEYEVAH